MYLNLIDILDLFLRFAVVGQISLMILLILSKQNNKPYLAAFTGMCITAYILLTAPIDNVHYGNLRGFLLIFTEFLPYLIWYLAVSLLKDRPLLAQNALLIKVIIGGVMLWFIYFFGLRQGQGIFHQINHYLQLIPLLHIVYLAIKDMQDDLVTARRNLRLMFTLLISSYFIFILMFEVAFPIAKQSNYFSVTNAAFLLISTSVFSWLFIIGKFTEPKTLSPDEALSSKSKSQKQKQIQIPVIYQNAYQQLSTLMADEFYRKSNLSINELAREVNLPEHQLRELINKHIGYRNFSDYLNSFRIPHACQQLADINQIRTPILTIALELGYGSVTTFNRAFKLATDKTPKEYRHHFQK